MNSLRKATIALGLLLAAASSHASNERFEENERFEKVLNNCLSRPGATVIDCARAGALAIDYSRLDVTQQIDLGTGEPGSAEGTVKVCETGGVSCYYYDCHETDDQSVCNFITWCNESHNPPSCTDAFGG